jgi:hypothetical protein
MRRSTGTGKAASNPAWVADHAIWEQAKAKAPGAPWGVITNIYKQLGGRVFKKADWHKQFRESGSMKNIKVNKAGVASVVGGVIPGVPDGPGPRGGTAGCPFTIGADEPFSPNRWHRAMKYVEERYGKDIPDFEAKVKAAYPRIEGQADGRADQEITLIQEVAQALRAYQDGGKTVEFLAGELKRIGDKHGVTGLDTAAVLRMTDRFLEANKAIQDMMDQFGGKQPPKLVMQEMTDTLHKTMADFYQMVSWNGVGSQVGAGNPYHPYWDDVLKKQDELAKGIEHEKEHLGTIARAFKRGQALKRIPGVDMDRDVSQEDRIRFLKLTALTAQEIAQDHLRQIPDYYTRLEKMEREAKGSTQSEVGMRLSAHDRFFVVTEPESNAAHLTDVMFETDLKGLELYLKGGGHVHGLYTMDDQATANRDALMLLGRAHK